MNYTIDVFLNRYGRWQARVCWTKIVPHFRCSIDGIVRVNHTTSVQMTHKTDEYTLLYAVFLEVEKLVRKIEKEKVDEQERQEDGCEAR